MGYLQHLFITFLFFCFSYKSFSQCANGNTTIKSVSANSGTGQYHDPLMQNPAFEVCYELESFFESSTNWVHGIFIDFRDIPAGFKVAQGSTGAQKTQVGVRNWVFFDSLQARSLGLPGPGYYVDEGDKNPRNNYGDNGNGTPNALFPNLQPFCFNLFGGCIIQRVIRPCVTVTGDGTTGAWKNGDCDGDQQCATSTGPNNNGTIVVCGAILDIKLLAFLARPEESFNIIEWTAIIDDNFSHFVLEKKREDDKEFKTLHIIPLVNHEKDGNKIKKLQIDNDHEGKNFYRLNMIDKDGSYTYSNIISIVNNRLTKVSVKFNNQDQNLRVKITGNQNKKGKINILDYNGKSVYTEIFPIGKSEENLVFNLPTMIPGVYLASVSHGSEIYTTKFVIE